MSGFLWSHSAFPHKLFAGRGFCLGSACSGFVPLQGIQSKCSTSFPPVKPDWEHYQDTGPGWREKSCPTAALWWQHRNAAAASHPGSWKSGHSIWQRKQHRTPNCAFNLYRRCPWIHQEKSSSNSNYPVSSATTAACSKCTSKYKAIRMETVETEICSLHDFTVQRHLQCLTGSVLIRILRYHLQGSVWHLWRNSTAEPECHSRVLFLFGEEKQTDINRYK